MNCGNVICLVLVIEGLGKLVDKVEQDSCIVGAPI
jgi:hypothetical protein